MTQELEHGRVHMYDSFRGFGFIRREKGKDVFFFYEEIQGDDKNILEGDHVSFEVFNHSKGPRAKNINKTG